MTRRERWTMLLLWIGLGLAPLFVRPLWEPDEARYAEIPREMLASGDWLTPRLNGVLYFEKPPLQYWLSAVSMRLFGLEAWAARLPLALASLITLWCAWKLAQRLGARSPRWAMLTAGAALLPFVVGSFLTLDALFAAFLNLGLVAFVEAVAARAEERPATAWTLLGFLAAALAVLTKGIASPVLLGGTLLLSLLVLKDQPGLRKAVLRTVFDPAGWALMLLVAAPWFMAVDKANPGHAKFFFVHEHFQRFTTHEHARQGSNNPVLDKLYFAGILLVGLLPWLTAALVGLRRAWRRMRSRGPQSEAMALHRWATAATFLGFAFPFAFFSLSGSKLPPYIQPVFVPLAALACAFEREGEEERAFRRMGVELFVLGGIFLAAAFAFQRELPGGPAWVLAAGGGFLALGLWTRFPKGLSGSGWMAGLTGAFLLLSLAAEHAAGPAKDMAALVRQAPAGAQWISYDLYHQGIPYYARTRCVVVAGTGELAYGRDHLPEGERARWFVEDPGALAATARRMAAEDPGRPVVAVLRDKDWDRLPPDQKGAFEEAGRIPGRVLAQLKR